MEVFIVSPFSSLDEDEQIMILTHLHQPASLQFSSLLHHSNVICPSSRLTVFLSFHPCQHYGNQSSVFFSSLLLRMIFFFHVALIYLFIYFFLHLHPRLSWWPSAKTALWLVTPNCPELYSGFVFSTVVNLWTICTLGTFSISFCSTACFKAITEWSWHCKSKKVDVKLLQDE